MPGPDPTSDEDVRSGWDITRLASDMRHRVLAEDASESGRIRSILIANDAYRGSPTSVFAYLGVPSRARPGATVPGMVCVHGGGGRAFRSWVEAWVARGYAAIAIDHNGRDGDGAPLPDAGPEQSHEVMFDADRAWRDTWTYHAVAAVVRSHGVLRGEPGVDAARIGITGISWGGYLTCLAAAVDARFACAIPVYGCGYLQRNSADGWMELFAAMSPAQRATWHQRCDPSLRLALARMPMLFVTGTNDTYYPLDILAMSQALPRAPVSLSVRPGMAHSNEAAWSAPEVPLFADAQLAGGAPLPTLSPPTWDGRRICAGYRAATRIARASLLLSDDRCRWQDRTWRAAPARLGPDAIEAEVPAGASACMLALEDERGALITTAPQAVDAAGRGSALVGSPPADEPSPSPVS